MWAPMWPPATLRPPGGKVCPGIGVVDFHRVQCDRCRKGVGQQQLVGQVRLPVGAGEPTWHRQGAFEQCSDLATAGGGCGGGGGGVWGCRTRRAGRAYQEHNGNGHRRPSLTPQPAGDHCQHPPSSATAHTGVARQKWYPRRHLVRERTCLYATRRATLCKSVRSCGVGACRTGPMVDLLRPRSCLAPPASTDYPVSAHHAGEHPVAQCDGVRQHRADVRRDNDHDRVCEN